MDDKLNRNKFDDTSNNFVNKIVFWQILTRELLESSREELPISTVELGTIREFYDDHDEINSTDFAMLSIVIDDSVALTIWKRLFWRVYSIAYHAKKIS